MGLSSPWRCSFNRREVRVMLGVLSRVFCSFLARGTRRSSATISLDCTRMLYGVSLSDSPPSPRGACPPPRPRHHVAGDEFSGEVEWDWPTRYRPTLPVPESLPMASPLPPPPHRRASTVALGVHHHLVTGRAAHGVVRRCAHAPCGADQDSSVVYEEVPRR